MSLRRSVERIWTQLEALTVDDMTPTERAAALDALTALEQNLQTADRLNQATA